MSHSRFHAVGLAILLAIGGCRSYEPHALNLERYQHDWHRQNLAGASVAAFADELKARGRIGPDRFAPGDGVTLAEAEVVALLLNPRLRVMRLQAEVPLVGARQAGRWDDPELSFDVLRVLANVDQPWIYGGGVGLTLPLSGRLAVVRDLAWADYSAAWREAALAEWQVLNELQEAWLRWSASERKLTLLRDHLDRLEPLATMAGRLVEAGELAATDARVLRMEVARWRVELQEGEAHVERERVALLDLLGLAPEAPVTLIPTLVMSEVDHDTNHWRAALHAHPELLLAKANYTVMEQRLHREIRRQYPDLTLGPVVEREQGQSRLGLGGGMPIPLWNRNTRAIREAEAAREAARAEAEMVLQKLTHRLDALHRQWQAARARRRALELNVAPLVDEQIREIKQLIELGELEVLLWQDALVRSLETKQAILEATLEEATANAALQAMVQPRWAMEPAGDAAKEHEE